MRGRVFRLSLGFASAVPSLLAQNNRQEFTHRLVGAALDRLNHTVRYDSAYVSIPYPGGDVPADTGVCTDEIIRIYRVLRIDLQKEVHEDMVNNLSASAQVEMVNYSHRHQHRSPSRAEPPDLFHPQRQVAFA